MFTSEAVLQTPGKKRPSLRFNRFELKDRELVQDYVDRFNPLSCEYNFSNLFAWQKAYKLTWAIYLERLLIYDGTNQCAFMPLGQELCPEELAVLSLQLTHLGLKPCFGLFTEAYIQKFPDIETYFMVTPERDYAEYIYEVKTLCELTGEKLHKKKNLISQFTRSYPDYRVHPLKGEFKSRCLEFAKELLNGPKKPPKELVQELSAIETSFHHFGPLGLEGIVVTVGERIAAFSVFSRLTSSTYDIQFEKADAEFKGAAQVINHETALYLKEACQYLNREQDLGIEGLRQAKMSYDPVELMMPYRLVFMPPN